MGALYNDGHRELQRRFDTERLATRIEERLVRDFIDAGDRAFIERCDMLFLATADAEGRPNCSYKGGDPGFVRVLDAQTIAFPNYDGNGMYLSTGNTLVNPNVGILFISFVTRTRVRLNGVASLHFDDPLLAEYPEAQFMVRVAARECSRTARGTSTTTSWWSAPGSCRRSSARLPYRPGRPGSGRATCCQRATRRRRQAPKSFRGSNIDLTGAS